jgi:protein-S-isoprenylcysteine O-methyltransferase Ste14
MFIRRVILSIVWNLFIFGTLLFLPAGTFHWWRAWVLMGVLLVATLITMLSVFRTRPELLKERVKGLIQKGQPWTDRILVVLFMVTYLASVAFISIDVFNLHIFHPPSVFVSSFGLVLVIIGWTIISLVFKENDFAAPVVRHQAEREHHVVDTGVYSIVRHPMYAGLALYNVGMALWLESYAAALLTLLPLGFLALRIVFEERFLKRELPGYTAYTERVRNRLIPFVW